MIPVIISGLSPTSYEKMKLAKKSGLNSIPLRTSQRVQQRKTKITKRKNEFSTKVDKENIHVCRKKTVRVEQFVEGTLARMKGNDDKRRQNLAKLKLQIYEENSKDLSFNPKLSASKKSWRKSVSKTQRNRSRTPLVDRVSKILNEKNSKLENIRKQKAKIKEDNEMKECTFAPTRVSGKSRLRKTKKEQMKSINKLYDWKRERDEKLVKSAIQKDEELVNKYSSVPYLHSGKARGKNLDIISARLMKQAKIKQLKIQKMQEEKTEGLFMPTLNKKSIHMTRKRHRKSYLGTAKSQTGRNDASFSRCKTPTKKHMRNLESQFKVTPVRRKIGAKELVSNFESSNQKSILKSRSTQKKAFSKFNSGCNKSTNRKIVFESRTSRKSEIQQYEIEESENPESSGDEMVDIPISNRSSHYHIGRKNEFEFSQSTRNVLKTKKHKYSTHIQTLDELAEAAEKCQYDNSALKHTPNQKATTGRKGFQQYSSMLSKQKKLRKGKERKAKNTQELVSVLKDLCLDLDNETEFMMS